MTHRFPSRRWRVSSPARAEIARSLTGSLDDTGKGQLSELAPGLIQQYAARQAIPL